MKRRTKIKVKKYTYEIILILIGCMIMAAGTSFFLLPNHLSSGGFAGIATIFYYLMEIPLGTTMIILNIPFLILSYLKLGKEFVIKTIIGLVVLSVAIDVFDTFTPWTQDKFLACIYGGILIGIGMGLVLKAYASTGGTDLLSYLVKHYKPHMSSSKLIVGIDAIIIAANVLFFKTIEVGLYSAIAIYLMGKMIDIIFEGVDFTKVMLIISDKYEKIAREIGRKVERGSTGIYAKGMYSKKDKMMLLCVGSRNEIARIKQAVVEIDNRAFIIIINSRETWGKGFKKEIG